jgi:hypothetical protein
MRKLLGPASQWISVAFIAGSFFASGYSIGTLRGHDRWQRLAARVDDLQHAAEIKPNCGTGVYNNRVVPEVNTPVTVPSMWFPVNP